MINVATTTAMTHNGHNHSSKGHHNHLDRGSENEDERKRVINSSRYKTELCRPYEESGICKYGDKCQFAHGIHELRALARHPKYKTELCRTYHTIGFCPYGPRCHFIHNEDEKRQPSMANGGSSTNTPIAATGATTTNGNIINKNIRGQHNHRQHTYQQNQLQQAIPLSDDQKDAGVQITMSRSTDSFKMLLEKSIAVQDARNTKYIVSGNSNLAYSNNDDCSNSSSSSSQTGSSTGSNGRIDANLRHQYRNKKIQPININNNPATAGSYSVIGGHRRKNLSYPTSTDSGNYSPIASPIAIQSAVADNSNALSSPPPPVQQFRSLSLGQPDNTTTNNNFNHSESPVIYNDIVSLIGPESNASDDVFENNQHSSYDNSIDQLSNNGSGKMADNEDSISSSSSVCSGTDDLNMRRLPVFDNLIN